MSQGPAELADLAVLADLAPALASTFVSVASDIALVIGSDGVIRNVAQGEAPLCRQAAQWVGQAFVDTVTQDTRGKIRQLLSDVDARGVSRRREVNLPGAEGADIPVAFAAIRLGANGPVLAVGRDLRAIAAIQQRVVDAQQELERDYWRQRQAETRRRLLFQVATDALMVVDADTKQIVETNAAAGTLFGTANAQLVGQPATAGIGAASRPAVDELLVTALSSGKPAEIRARLQLAVPGDEVTLVDVSATPFRACGDGVSHIQLLVRIRRSEGGAGLRQQRQADPVEQMSDAVVVTDSSGRVLMANPALLAMCQPGTDESGLKGRTLAQVLGDPGHRLDALVDQVRRCGIVASSRVMVGGLAGVALQELEVSAALLEDGDQECIGITLRRPVDRPSTDLPPVVGLAAAIDALVRQLGRVSLPELMHEATDLAEKHLLRHALASTNGNPQLAAERLGISPDSLSLRLQRHGLLALPGTSWPPTLLN